MNAQLRRQVIELLRENVMLRAENGALANMLDVAELTGEVPAKWRSILEETQKTHVYRNLIEQYEPLFHHIERTEDEGAIEELLQHRPSAQLAV